MVEMAKLWNGQISLQPFDQQLSESEIARVYRWSKDERVLRWSGGSPTELSFEEFRERLQSEQRNPVDDRLAFFVFAQDGALLGRIGIFAIDWDARAGELGIVIGETAEWDKGYGRQATMLLLQHIFETTALERINLYTFVDNVRAQRCFAACGFRALGTARRFSPDIGEYDGIEMEITKREFFLLHASQHTNSASR